MQRNDSPCKGSYFLLKWIFLELNKIWFSLILYSKHENCASPPFAERDNFVSQCTAFCGTRVLYSHCVTRRIWSTFFSRSLRNEGRKEWRRSAENLRFNVDPVPMRKKEKEANILVENETQCLQADTIGIDLIANGVFYWPPTPSISSLSD